MPKRNSRGLSVRERQVVDLAAAGLTDLQIAESLKIRPSTVATYWDRIRLKFGAHTRAELVLHVFQETCQSKILELQRQIKALHAVVERGEDLYRHALEDAADAVLLVDRLGKVLVANRSAEEMFGYGPGELEGVPHDKLLFEADRSDHRSKVAAYFEAPVAQTMGGAGQVLARRKDGQAIPIVASIAPVHDDGSETAICIVRPEKKQRAAA